MPSDQFFLFVGEVGAAKPSARMLAAICRTCFFECVRAFLGWGLIWSIGTTM
jgi:hypothetical protein